MKNHEHMREIEQKVYKVWAIGNNNILPGDLKGSPDDYLLFSNLLIWRFLYNG